MAAPSFRAAARALRARVAYRLDSFLGYPPVVQLLVLLALTFFVVFAWAVVLRLALPHDPAVPNEREALWWSLTHFLDGGTMASDPLGRRLLALGSTVSGVLVLSLVTAAFASKMGERIGDLRSGSNPVVERGHVLALGFDAKVALMAREMARSGQRRTLVILSPEDKAKVEVALRPARRVARSRLRLVVRTGDPRSEHALLRVSAQLAASAIVVPPAALDDEAAVQWTFATLLALRRTADEGFAGSVIVEARHAETRALLELAGEPGVAGPAALRTEVVASDDVVARILAQSARQEGVYYALRQILEFDGCEIYVEGLPGALRGKRFDEAHARVTGAVLLGVRTKGGALRLCPAPGDPHVLAAGDELVVLAPARGAIRVDGALPPARRPVEGAAVRACVEAHRPETVVLLGFNRTLPHLVREFDEILPRGSKLRVVCGEHGDCVEELLHELAPRLAHVTVECDARRPVDLARAGDAAVLDADSVVILGCADETDDNGDARALATLLWLRHTLRAQGRELRRVVTEVRDPRSAAHVRALSHDFVVSTDVVAMLLAQEALDPRVAPVYRELLSPEGTEVFLRPASLYAPAGATFGEVMAAARERGEVALGFYPHAPEAPGGALAAPYPTWLNPPRDARVPDDCATQVVVLAPPEGAVRAARAA